MNTSKSIAALLGAALILCTSAFAGPGPRPIPTVTDPVRTVGVASSSPVTVAFTGHAPAAEAPAYTTQFISTPHGTVTVLLRAE